MKMNKSIMVKDGLFLVETEINKEQVIDQPSEVNHIVVIDCSGSMSGELPKIREKLKKKLPKLLSETDTLSIIWFSGKKEFGVLVENEPVSTLKDLIAVERMIDRWLRPVGLTGFKEPLQEVKNLCNRLRKVRPNSVNSLFFMSDGYDNQWTKNDILETISDISGLVSSCTIVEYGYYADRQMLTMMADKSGGNLVFADDFDKYTPVFESAMSKKIFGGKKIQVDIPNDVIGGFSFSIKDDEILTFSVENGKALVPENIGKIFFLSNTKVGDLIEYKKEHAEPVYAAISLFSGRMNSGITLDLLKLTGDVRFIKEYSNCFGKQRVSDFSSNTKAAVFNPEFRLSQGYDANALPRDDAFTVLDFLNLLTQDPENKLLLDSNLFSYSKIGRSRIDSNDVLTASEQAEINELSERLKETKDPKEVRDISQRINDISNKPDSLKFEPIKQHGGYSISGLTYNEDRPNISFLVKKNGWVDLSNRLTHEMKKIPSDFKTFVYRNYAIIKDGLLNIKTLPVKLTKETIDKINELISSGHIPADFIVNTFLTEDNLTRVVNLELLPIVNRNMVKTMSAKDLFSKSFALIEAQSAFKVFNTVKKEKFSKKSETFASIYGEKEAIWLKEQGITDYSGFSPKSVLAESSDFYIGKELKVSIKGYSTIPSLKEAREKIKSGKISGPVKLMIPAIESLDNFLSSDIYNKSPDKDKLLETWLNTNCDYYQETARSLIKDVSQITLSVILSQSWFNEFSSMDENSLNMIFNGDEVKCTVEARDIEIKI